jgi:valyl-tRNA synthetase
MSKSRGNTIDPVDVIERFGTDALRLSLMWGCVLGQDMSYAEDRIEGARRFCNKLWNAARFVLASGDGSHTEFSSEGVASLHPPDGLALEDRWILSRLAQTVTAVDGALERYELSEAARAIYEFVWSEFCDWYLEMAKLSSGDREHVTRAVLVHTLETALRLAHPIIPFITEEIWQRLPRRAGDAESIMVAPWPSTDGTWLDADAEDEMSFLQEIVVEVRRFRHEHRIPPNRRIPAVIAAEGRFAELIRSHAAHIGALAWLEDVRLGDAPPGWSRLVAGQAEVYLPLAEIIDVGAERGRLEREIAEAEELATRARSKLDNTGFSKGAPPEVVAKTRGQLEEHEGRVARLRRQLEELV